MVNVFMVKGERKPMDVPSMMKPLLDKFKYGGHPFLDIHHQMILSLVLAWQIRLTIMNS